MGKGEESTAAFQLQHAYIWMDGVKECCQVRNKEREVHARLLRGKLVLLFCM